MDDEHGFRQSDAPRASEGNIFSRLWWTFVSPSKLFADIERASIWWQPWILVSVVGLIGLFIAAPVNRAVMELNPRGMDPETLRESLEVMDKYAFFGYFIVPLAALLQALIVSAAGYVVVSVVVAQGTFKQYFTLYLYSSIIASVGAAVSVLLARLKGIDSIRSLDDATVSFGLDFLVPEGHGFLQAAAASVNVFSIWSFVVVAMGLMHLFRAGRNQAILAVIPLWLVNLVFAMIAAAISKAA